MYDFLLNTFHIYHLSLLAHSSADLSHTFSPRTRARAAPPPHREGIRAKEVKRQKSAILAMSDDEFDELMEMVEREEAERNHDLGLDVMDVVNICYIKVARWQN